MSFLFQVMIVWNLYVQNDNKSKEQLKRELRETTA